MNAAIYIEGGGDSKQLHVLCREGFRKLFENCGFAGRMPKLIACGSRSAALDDFRIAHEKSNSADYIAMLVDSEDGLADIEATWRHLRLRDGWRKPKGADDAQVLLMTTCMETWIVADRLALARHFGSALQKSALPSLANLENKSREVIQDSLAHATRKCRNAYAKGKRSFAILAQLDPRLLEQHLPSFARALRIFGNKLR